MNEHASSRSAGFTLPDLLIVLVMLGLTMTLMSGFHGGGLTRSKQMKTLTNGRGIYIQLFAATMEGAEEDPGLFAKEKSEHYDSSTAYFEWLMTPEKNGGAEVLEQDFSVFAYSSTQVAKGFDDFDATRNIWSVVTGLDANSPAGMPFLVTKNLNEKQLVDWEENMTLPLKNLDLTGKNKVFAKPALLLVQAGGAAMLLSQPQQLTWSTVNPHKTENKILAP